MSINIKERLSLREIVTTQLVTILKDIETPRPVLVTRDPFEVAKLAITQFPALLIQSGTELRQTATMGMHPTGTGRRVGTIDFTVKAFVRGAGLDGLRNALIEAIEDQIEKTPWLGLRDQGVMDASVTSIVIIERLEPLSETDINISISYNYNRGNT